MIKKIFLPILLIITASFTFYFISHKDKEIVKIGILHSLSGTMQISEKGVVEATLAAVEEINSAGGILGKQIKPIVSDGMSNPKIFAKKAETLIEQDGVSAIFGCWTSASRKEVKGVVEKFNHLLFYPVQYEGIEDSGSIVYLGQLPNQQIKPAFLYALNKYGKDMYLVGSDYVYPRVANEYIKGLAASTGANIVGERYLPLGGDNFESIVLDIKAKKPKSIFNNLNGDSNIAFFRELYRQGIKSEDIPVFSFSIGKNEIAQIASIVSKDAVAGHYASWSYFDNIKTEQNGHFKKIMAKRGIDNPTDPMEAAYVAVWIYKQAVEAADSFEPSKVKSNIAYQSFKGPSGITSITRDNMNAWKSSRIARINSSLEFEILKESIRPFKPENYPTDRTKDGWEALLLNLYNGWGQNWAAKNE